MLPFHSFVNYKFSLAKISVSLHYTGPKADFEDKT